MNWYTIAKVVHFLGLIALFGYFVMRTHAGRQLRAARTVEQVSATLDLLAVTSGMLRGGVGLMLLSGLAMAGLRWRGPYPFVVVGLVTLLLIGALAEMAGGRHLRAIRAATEGSSGALPDPVARVILDPTKWGLVSTANGAALGVLVVMTMKLSWLGAVACVLVLSALVGGIMTALVRRQAASLGRAGR